MFIAIIDHRVIVDNKTKGRVSKGRQQENKARQTLQKKTFLTT